MMLSPGPAVLFIYFYCMFNRRPTTITDCVNGMHWRWKITQQYNGFMCLFTSLMSAVDQRIWRAPSAAIMLFCNINKIFVHVNGYLCLQHFFKWCSWASSLPAESNIYRERPVWFILHSAFTLRPLRFLPRHHLCCCVTMYGVTGGGDSSVHPTAA